VVDKSNEDELLSLLLDSSTPDSSLKTNKIKTGSDKKSLFKSNDLFGSKLSDKNPFGDDDDGMIGDNFISSSNKKNVKKDTLFGDDDDDFLSMVQAADKKADKSKSTTLINVSSRIYIYIYIYLLLLLIRWT
jgi:hypothetical protein